MDGEIVYELEKAYYNIDDDVKEVEDGYFILEDIKSEINGLYDLLLELSSSNEQQEIKSAFQSIEKIYKKAFKYN